MEGGDEFEEESLARGIPSGSFAIQCGDSTYIPLFRTLLQLIYFPDARLLPLSLPFPSRGLGNPF